MREYAAAKQSHEQALAICRKSLPPDHPDIAFSLRNLGLQGLKSGVGVGDAVPGLAEATDLFQAEQLRLAVAQAEQEQLATAALAKISLGDLLSATLITSAEPASAYDRVVRVKGSVTAQQRWARQARDAADPDTARLLNRLRQVTRQIVGLSMDNRPAQSKSDPRDVPDEIRTLSAERDELERQLTERSAVYRTIQARARVGSGEVRTALPAGSALIDLVDYLHLEPPAKGQTEPSEEPRVVAFVVRPERPEVVIVSLGPSQALAEWIDRWRASYGAGKAPPAGETDPGAELRKRLWEPLAKHLEGVKVVLVSPDGPLNGVPWAALPGSKVGTFLVHECAFAVVPVPQLLPELLRGTPGPEDQQPSLVLAGGIDFGKAKARDPKAEGSKLPPLPFFKPLPGTESEVNDLRAQFEEAFPHAPAKKPLSKDKATKEAVVAAMLSHRFVHLATHGFFADGSEPSAEAMAERSELFEAARSCAPRRPGGTRVCSPGWSSPASTSRNGGRRTRSSRRLRCPRWSWARWSWWSSAPARPGAVGWPAARGCWGSSAPSNWPGPARWWLACGECPTRRPTSSCASSTGASGRSSRCRGRRRCDRRSCGCSRTGRIAVAWSDRGVRKGRPHLTSGPLSSSRGTGGERHRAKSSGLKTVCPLVGFADPVSATFLV